MAQSEVNLTITDAEPRSTDTGHPRRLNARQNDEALLEPMLRSILARHHPGPEMLLRLRPAATPGTGLSTVDPEET